MSVLARRRLELTWTALCGVVVAAGLALSEGEPVCDGPFIWRQDDSVPPRCPSPLDALPWMVSAWVLGLVLLVVARLITEAAGRRGAGHGRL
jgi:hypothetical protein